MWPFIPGERFPYANFHSMNQDWIIKVVKEFKDQYENIQQLIQNTTNEGLEELDNKMQNINALLDQWYNTHSSDIQNQLANAINDITAYVNQVLQSIPQDYSTWSYTITDNIYNIQNADKLINEGIYNPLIHWYQQSCSGSTGECENSQVQIRSQILYVGKSNVLKLEPASGYLTHVRWFSDINTFVSSQNIISGYITAPEDFVIICITTSDYGTIGINAGNTAANIEVISMKFSAIQGKIYSMAESANPDQYVNIDLVNKIVKFGNSTSGSGRCYLRDGRKSYQIGGKTVSFASVFTDQSPYAFFYYEIPTDTIIVIDAGSNSVRDLSNNYIYIGSIWGIHYSVNFNVYPFYYVNGAKTYSDDKNGTFDSNRAYGYSEYNIAVLGDSISAFPGYSETEINNRAVQAPYYPHDTLTEVSQMWWHLLHKKLRFGNHINVSAISRSRYLDTIDSAGVYAPAMWNDERINRLQANSNLPHYIFIMAGINDGYSINKYGEFGYNNIISAINTEPESIAKGIELTLTKIINANPYARIVLLIPAIVANGIPDFNWKSYTKTCELIKQIGEAYGIYKIIDLRKCGITPGNIDVYTFDGTHPNPDGMKIIAEYVYQCMTDNEQPVKV